MSISSDISISREDARSIVKNLLLYEQEKLIDQAIKGMQDSDLRNYLNKDSDLYYYTIKTEKKNRG